jgi:DNA-binding response OmpR family regulator
VAFIPWPHPPAPLAPGTGRAGPARLYLVEPGAAPPAVTSCLEDWVRLPVSDDEVSARATALMLRLRWHHPHQDRPYLDAMGVLHLGDRWVDLPPLEARLFSLLLERLEESVPTRQLLDTGWGPGADRTGNLRIQILRLRRRLAPVGLVIHTLPGRGYMLAWARPDHGASPEPGGSVP